MKPENLYATPFANVYPHYVKKAETTRRIGEELYELFRSPVGYIKS